MKKKRDIGQEVIEGLTHVRDALKRQQARRDIELQVVHFSDGKKATHQAATQTRRGRSDRGVD